MKKTLYQLFLALIIATPFIELANAFLLRSHSPFEFLGDIVKGALLVFALIILEKKQRSFYLLALAIGAIFAIIHFSIEPQHSTSYLFADLLFVIKVTYIIPLSFILSSVSKRFLFTASLLTWVTIVINIAFGLVGWGYTQYVRGYGYKGFFYAGNEMALTLIVTSAIVLFQLYSNKKTSLAFVFSIGLLLLGPIQGMKTLIFSLPLVTFVVPLLYYNNKVSSFLKQVTRAKLLGILSLGIVFVIATFGFIRVVSPQSFVRFSQIASHSGIVAAVWSERDIFLKTGLTMYTHDYSPAQKIFGAGNLLSQNGMAKYLKTPKTIEIDFFDLFFTFGFLAFFYYFIWGLYVRRLLMNKTPESKFVSFVNVVLIGMSILTGHVVYSTFLITYWAMLNTLIPKENRNKIYFLGSISPGGISVYMKETAKQAKDLAVTILPTHVPGPLTNTILAFTITYFSLVGILLTETINRNKTILHLHMATTGSFVRKAIILFTLSWFSDQTVLHLHSGETVKFLTKVNKLPGGKLLLTCVFSLPDDIVTVSQNLHNEATDFLHSQSIKVIKAKWHVLANAIEIPSSLPSLPVFDSTKEFRIITVSRLNPVKKLTLIPKIAKILKDAKLNFSISIVGDGPDKNNIEEAIAQEGVANYVKLLGPAPHNEVGKHYEKANLFLQTSLFEGFSIVILEAYLYGLPAITSDIGGLREIVINDQTGYRCDITRPEDFAQAILALAKNKNKYSEMSKNSQSLVLKYSYKEYIEKLGKIYGV